MIGQYLNSMDGDLGAALEQYLPNPIFRLMVRKKRLDGEIATLRTILSEQEVMLEEPDFDIILLRQRITAMRARLRILEAHAAQVRQELLTRLPVTALIDRFLNSALLRILKVLPLWIQTQEQFGRQIFFRLFYGKDYLKRESGFKKLNQLQTFYTRRIHDANLSDQELSQILNQCDRLILQLEKSS